MSRVLIAAGGTGGHLCIGIAVAQALMQANPSAQLLLLGARFGFDELFLRASGFSHAIIPTKPLPRRLSPELLLNPPLIIAAVLRVLALMRSFRPQVVLGAGGYASVPAVLAAKLLRIPVLMHEPDAIPGVANRFLGRFASAISLGYAQAAGFWPNKKCHHTGNPVREAIISAQREDSRRSLGVEAEEIVIAVLGGSQGARSINLTVVEASPELLTHPGIKLFHITGRRDYELIAEHASRLPLSLQPRYILFPFLEETQMGQLLAAADLAVTRAGASTLAEIACRGLPAVIIPYPHAASGHQRQNANFLLEAKRAVMLEDTGLTSSRLSTCVSGFLGSLPRVGQLVSSSAGSQIAHLLLEFGRS